MIYLASPYSHLDPSVREARYVDACRATASLLSDGYIVFSPIVHSHPLVRFGLNGGWEFWEQIDREHLWRCDEVVVLMLDGWRESVGVRDEIQIAGEFDKPVRYLDPYDIYSPTFADSPPSVVAEASVNE